MTPNERFAAWLADAMRAAGMEIDKQRGGGRMALAAAIGASPSSVARWLDAKVRPDPDYYEPLANALGVPVVDMLVETGILSADSLLQLQRSGVRSQPTTVAQAADDLGFHDPDSRAEFERAVERLKRRRLQATQDGETGEAIAT